MKIITKACRRRLFMIAAITIPYYIVEKQEIGLQTS